MHLFAARFQEQHGDVAAARASLELVTDKLATDDIKVSTALLNLHGSVSSADVL